MRTRIFLLLIWLFSITAEAQNTLVKGIVTDSVTGEGLPYTAIKVKDKNIGTTTDTEGKFSFSIPNTPCVLQVSYMGYITQELPVRPSGKTITWDIRLIPADFTLKEVTVKPRREHYRRRENPAVAFVRNVINSRKANDPRQHDYFSYDQYEKTVIAQNEYTPKKRGKTNRGNSIS